jgi:hypothetical protein
MSEQQPFRQEDDHLRPLPTVLLIVAVLVMIGIGIYWPWAMLESRDRSPAPEAELGSPPKVRTPPRDSIGSVRQTLIGEQALQEHIRQRPLEPAVEPIDRWDWVDRERGVVKVPIEVAMELWLERAASRVEDEP